MDLNTNPPASEVGIELVELIRQLIREELDAREGSGPTALGDYDTEACAALTREFGVNSLNRAGDFFGKLAVDGAADSLTMAAHLSLGTPRNLSSALTTPVKRLSKRLGLGLPWSEEVTPEGRTLWRDRDGIAERMYEAVKAEQHRRSLGPV